MGYERRPLPLKTSFTVEDGLFGVEGGVAVLQTGLHQLRHVPRAELGIVTKLNNNTAKQIYYLKTHWYKM